VAKQNKNEFELLRLKQSLRERYFYHFDSFWYTGQTSINVPFGLHQNKVPSLISKHQNMVLMHYKENMFWFIVHIKYNI